MAPETGTSGKVVAVVPAAGSGERLAAGIPKAFCLVDGRTLLQRASIRRRMEQVSGLVLLGLGIRLAAES